MSSFKKFFKNYKGSRFERFSWKLDDLIHELTEKQLQTIKEYKTNNFLINNYFRKHLDEKLKAKHEKEFLIKRGSRFKILSKKQIDENEYEVEMELL